MSSKLPECLLANLQKPFYSLRLELDHGLYLLLERTNTSSLPIACLGTIHDSVQKLPLYFSPEKEMIQQALSCSQEDQSYYLACAHLNVTHHLYYHPVMQMHNEPKEFYYESENVESLLDMSTFNYQQALIEFEQQAELSISTSLVARLCLLQTTFPQINLQHPAQYMLYQTYTGLAAYFTHAYYLWKETLPLVHIMLLESGIAERQNLNELESVHQEILVILGLDHQPLSSVKDSLIKEDDRIEKKAAN